MVTLCVLRGKRHGQALSRASVTEEVRVSSQAGTYEICDCQSGTGTGFFPENFGFSL